MTHGGKRKNAGRPAKPKAERRSKCVRVYLTEEEHERLRTITDSGGQTPSAFCAIAAMQRLAKLGY